MEVSVILDTSGAAAAGIDREALISDIDEELRKLAASAGASPPSRTATPAPDGAQGDLSIIQWVLDVATDPTMAKAYAATLVYAVNSILSARTKPDETGSKDGADQAANRIVKLRILGKEFLLPATTSGIKSLLESLGDQ